MTMGSGNEERKIVLFSLLGRARTGWGKEDCGGILPISQLPLQGGREGAMGGIPWGNANRIANYLAPPPPPPPPPRELRIASHYHKETTSQDFLKESGSGDWIQKILSKLLGLHQSLYTGFLNFDELSLLPFSTRLRWKHMGEILFIGEISTKFLYGLCCFQLVHWMNSWFQ
jgi:hypothetical protein